MEGVFLGGYMAKQRSKIPEDVHVLEWMEKIDDMYEKRPDRRTKEYKDWKKEFNELVDKVNGWVGKIYNKV